MINFELDTEIHAPLQLVIKLFEDRSQLSSWQQGFISDENIGDMKGKETYKLVYKAGNRNISLTESIVHSNLPERYEVIYRMKGMKNTVIHRFSSKGDSVTLWEAHHTISFRWLMVLIGPRMRLGLEQQSRLLMQHFRKFAERSYLNM